MSQYQSIPAMDPSEFLQKWGPRGQAHRLNERAGAQPHFLDLCRVLGVSEPTDPDSYCFERSFHRTNTALGFADVWKRGFFAWEYKSPGASLSDALDQLMQYAMPLENPPLLVVSDRIFFQIHTHFTGYASECIAFGHNEIIQPETRRTLRAVFSDPYSFRPNRSSIEITQDAAKSFAAIAERMQARGTPPHQAAHFLTQCLFCMFAQDAGLLRTDLFKSLTENKHDPEGLRRGLDRLFAVMRTGGDFGIENIAWFNGGLFEVVDVPVLTEEDLSALRAAACLDWRGLDPGIFGTLFERGLDPRKRRQLGAHYTDPATISKLVIPVVERPLLAAWSTVKVEIEQLMGSRDSLREAAERIPSTTRAEQAKHSRTRGLAKVAEEQAQSLFNEYLEHLRDFRVLDPACGSGNFLYVALRTLKDIEHRVNLEAEGLGLHRQLPFTGPQNVLGLEVNAYAAELSRVTIWIGELQWRMQRGFGWKSNPILDPLDQIECRDALVNPDGSEAEWPTANVIVGNPPFVGDKKMRGELGDTETTNLRRVYAGRVPGGADLVCYWFEKARGQIERAGLGAAGLVATNSIRGGKNREVLGNVVRTTRIFEAWSDEPWVNEGASVRVSLIAFGRDGGLASLNGKPVENIGSDLSPLAGKVDSGAPAARALLENNACAFQGPTKGGSFDVPGALARQWLSEPALDSASNSSVLLPWANGAAVTGRWPDRWIIDFGERDLTQAAVHEGPFRHVHEVVRPERLSNAEKGTRERYWLFKRSGSDYKVAIQNLGRYLATPEVSKHRIFVWLPCTVAADKNLVVIAREDDTTFGVLQSRLHTVWSLKLGTSLEDRPRYTSISTFRTFPFPIGFTPADTSHQQTERVLESNALIPAMLQGAVRSTAEVIASAARRLVLLRDAWLNPSDWTEKEAEIAPIGFTRSPYPDRVRARAGFEAQLASRTLTKLYNQMPMWLVQAHQALDVAVAVAYGWNDYSPKMPDEEILRRLLAENLQRAQRQAGAQIALPLLSPIRGSAATSNDDGLVEPQAAAGKGKLRRQA
ncbi:MULTISPECIES: class I SAM-dependent DNA methyltransferase [unclassified Rhizobacter]|uniref:class I SAM-dependent DNA methyltransferase n=1 Tax=unclassified Rhizobacter TaxID=2640088 RepID=UPI000A602E09|nr:MULTISPECIES: class I SAM-dependent DNA methyltransferase [unclassified Rhizobacter]